MDIEKLKTLIGTLQRYDAVLNENSGCPCCPSDPHAGMEEVSHGDYVNLWELKTILGI